MKKLIMVVVAVVAVAQSLAGQNVSTELAGQTVSSELVGQKVPSEEDILAATMSATSPYYYPAMMMRYLAGDATLTDQDYYYLYYGYAYSDAYNGHATLPGEERILEILASTPTPSKTEARVIIEAATENMKVDPFSPSNVNMMTFAYSILGDTINEIVSANRFNKILKAIESSGTGLKESSPWHVLRFSHAADVVAALGYQIVNRQVRTSTVEYIQFAKNPDRAKGLFFDFGRVYWKPHEGERPQRKSNWEFNGVPLKRNEK
jgi:hypothetical protein